MNLMIAVGVGDSLLLAWILVGAGVVAVYRFFRWFFAAPVQPEPWSAEVTAQMEEPEARALCCHCLEPHDGARNFCPDCGAPVGQYTNLLPFPYLFSIGHLLRTGTGGEFKRTPLTIVGYFLVGLIEYSLFAPIYWILFLTRLGQPSNPDPGPPPLPEVQD